MKASSSGASGSGSGMAVAGAANRNIAELGIGTNDRATRPDNILEAEKILGTVHIALGDNSGFGGTVSTPFHEDYVFYRPTLTAVMTDGSERTLLLDGKPVFMDDVEGE